MTAPKIKILFLTLSMLSLQLAALEKWTLNDCINFAIKNNLQLQEAALNLKLAETNYNQSKWNLLPGVNAGTDAGMNFGRSVDPNTNGIINTSFFNNSYHLGASVDLFRGFMLQNHLKFQKFRKEAAENNKISVTDDLAFSVMNAFFNVLYYEELLKIANEQKALSEMNVKKTQVLVTTGLKAQTDLLEVRANFEKEELFCIQTANNLASSWINLKKAMNLPPDQKIGLEIPETGDDNVAEISTDIPELFAQHSTWSAEIRAFELDWKASQKSVQISKGGFLPSLRLQAAYNTGFYETNKDSAHQVIDFRKQINNNQRQFVGASLSIPLFNRNAVRFEVRRSEIASGQVKTRLEIARQNLLYEMEENYNELSASWKEFQQAKKQLEADTLAFEASQKKYNQGMINVVELYTTKNRMATTTSQVLYAKLTYAARKRVLDFYRGNRFWEL